MARTATVRLSDEDEAKLARIGARSGLSVSDAIRRAIDGLDRELRGDEGAVAKKTAYEAYLEIMAEVPGDADGPSVESATNEAVRRAFAEKDRTNRARNGR